MMIPPCSSICCRPRRSTRAKAAAAARAGPARARSAPRGGNKAAAGRAGGALPAPSTTEQQLPQQ